MPQGSKQNGDDGALVLIVAIIVAMVLIPMLWKVLAPKLSAPITYWASVELSLFPWLSRDARAIADELIRVRQNNEVLSYAGLRSMLSVCGRYLSFLLIPLLIVAMLRVQVKPKQIADHVKRFGAQDLIDHQAAFWAASAPLKGLNLEDPKHANHPYARRALTPAEWAILTGAARDVKAVLERPDGEQLWFDECAPMNATGVERVIPKARIGKERFLLLRCSYDPQAAEAAFISQLGRPFTGWDKMPAHYFGVVCFFLAHIGSDKQLEWRLQYELIASEGKPGPCCAEVWHQHATNPLLARLAAIHGWNATAIRALAAESKRLGGKTESWWVWLKAVDYALYINLNEDGRLVAWPESAGVRAQLEAERTMGVINAASARAGQAQLHLQVAYVEPAVKALHEVLDSIGAIKEDGILLTSST